jgi:hypothetical protein
VASVFIVTGVFLTPVSLPRNSDRSRMCGMRVRFRTTMHRVLFVSCVPVAGLRFLAVMRVCHGLVCLR